MLRLAGYVSYTFTDDSGDLDSEAIDLADLADADALEDILHGTSNASAHDQPMANEARLQFTPEPDQTDVGVQPDMIDSELAATVNMEPFPFGRPGAPIPSRAQQPSEPNTQATILGSPWGPFQSQLEWDVAHWVKLRGGSQSAVLELLAIPGVCGSTFLYGVSNLL